jgi:hypothetical protein
MGHRTRTGILLQTGFIGKLFLDRTGAWPGKKFMVFLGFTRRMEAWVSVKPGFTAPGAVAERRSQRRLKEKKFTNSG